MYTEALIEALNEYSLEKLGFKVNAKFATPSEYFLALEKEIADGKLELQTF